MKKAYPGHANARDVGIWSFLRTVHVHKIRSLVVDDDIDARNWKDVMWRALDPHGTRLRDTHPRRPTPTIELPRLRHPPKAASAVKIGPRARDDEMAPRNETRVGPAGSA